MIIPKAENILIIKWGALGDLIMATPAVRTIRDNYPDARITMLANPLMNELLPEKYLIDNYIFLKKSGRRVDESIIKQLMLIREIRKRKFDLVINLKWKSERASLIAFLSGSKIRVGYKENFFFNAFTHHVPHPEGGYHEVYRNLDILNAIGLKRSEEKPLILVPDKDRKFSDDFFESNSLIKEKTVCIHPGASKSNRAWLPERYIELSRRFIERFNVNVLITYGKDELPLARSIAAGIGPGAFLSPETHSISQLAAIIDHCSLFVSVCTGPMNVANSVSTPIIALLGSTDPLDWSPFGAVHSTIKSPLILKEYTDEDERRALDLISVQNVWEIAEKRWKELMNL